MALKFVAVGLRSKLWSDAVTHLVPAFTALLNLSADAVCLVLEDLCVEEVEEITTYCGIVWKTKKEVLPLLCLNKDCAENFGVLRGRRRERMLRRLIPGDTRRCTSIFPLNRKALADNGECIRVLGANKRHTLPQHGADACAHVDVGTDCSRSPAELYSNCFREGWGGSPVLSSPLFSSRLFSPLLSSHVLFSSPLSSLLWHVCAFVIKSFFDLSGL